MPIGWAITVVVLCVAVVALAIVVLGLLRQVTQCSNEPQRALSEPITVCMAQRSAACCRISRRAVTAARIGMKRMTVRDPVASATPPNRAPTVKPTLRAARL